MPKKLETHCQLDHTKNKQETSSFHAKRRRFADLMP